MGTRTAVAIANRSSAAFQGEKDAATTRPTGQVPPQRAMLTTSIRNTAQRGGVPVFGNLDSFATISRMKFNIFIRVVDKFVGHLRNVN